MSYVGPTDLYIGGEWRSAAGGARFAVTDPATEAVIAEVADADVADARTAADAAADALPGWTATSPRERAEVLRLAFEAMMDHQEELARLIVCENGKPLADARGEVAYAAEFFRWYSEEAVRAPGELTRSPGGERRILTISKPVGVSLLITPWNLPAAMVTRKVAPALAAGCTVVVKPSFQTPLVALRLAELIAEAGAPAGVVNVVPTTRDIPVVGDLLERGPVRMLSFTGSTRVGSALLAQAAARVINCSMELGGNAPFIVLRDADLEAAVRGALAAKLRHSSQACTAANRFFVHEDLAEQFAVRLAEEMSALKIGHGLEEGSQLGPLISAAAVDATMQRVHAAVDDGAALLTNQSEHPGQGHFIAPSVLSGVKPDAAILQDELFAPVAPVIAFRDDDEVIRMANETDMGLASYVFSADLAHALRVAEALDTGMVGVNTGVVSDPAAPFGGTKQSGIGREGGHHGMAEFLETQYLAVNW
ncbi:aldehyde dehydrogenase family protein [Streptomyces sp. NPDC008092]|uniref:NAD-dependent succinate-semialdehyde dehydrogenase n=1 Tax=Streptomyces sp. NPDC008092 TaxID=3364808 RepID=UPI0036ECC21D